MFAAFTCLLVSSTTLVSPLTLSPWPLIYDVTSSCILHVPVYASVRNVWAPQLLLLPPLSLPFLPTSLTFISLYFLPHYPSFYSTTLSFSVCPSSGLHRRLFVLSDSSSHSRDWDHHRQLVLMYFAQKAKGDAWCNETVWVSECPSYQMPTCSSFLIFAWPFPSSLQQLCLAPTGEWRVSLEWGLVPVVLWGRGSFES